jgi:hypothetical protein
MLKHTHTMKQLLFVPAFVLAIAFTPTVSAQEADTLRIDTDRVVVIIEDGNVILRRSDRSGEVEEREVRIGDGDRQSAVRVMRRRGVEGDTLRFDVERIVERARDMASVFPREIFDEIEFSGHPLGERLEERREITRMEAETRDLARRARAASGSERQRLETELRTQLDSLLSRRLDAERDRVDQLEEQASERRSRLENRMASRGEIVERRMRALLGDSDDLDW